MKTAIATLALVTALGMGASRPAEAGCLTGAAVGGVGGHLAGHHALLGAGAGCIVGHYHAKHERQRELAAQQQQSYGQGQQGYATQRTY